ncbi:hypothetical protein C4D60_Mb11t14730 [Musa balbisiana]|uniref:Uncharacterized protein n=1 Tax=Musa balbisiana TaxID=52838 RepID=A0A4V6T4A3_MUSBA|nr:hypothetical protein C4D60_Mb11t14730 [Musa balbisiana]
MDRNYLLCIRRLLRLSGEARQGPSTSLHFQATHFKEGLGARPSLGVGCFEQAPGASLRLGERLGNWTYETDDENDYSAQPEFTSERLALGLRAFGPLNIEEK